ncbi:Polysaccharide deacetylase [Pseudonocardia sp. Ae168_Ps1]|uniref:polysaccharide deacetylase family protein n=1 Tax=unclassified Pseudonocardia TaxID=2619320 RepID=UPI00094B6672|nr:MULTISPECIES: polysaccharide deacetylase family protein [unclassified Pseudonocardia]OLL79622.1 Polysaccharide deacetylase [Pseudonocardia sp. Ae168_Ps1]OLL86242.1 Polysaccharide deacetylase [Pseudonocardia sp. Ae263_Ps1]OLL93727.1 Polysaccharide deacetylase [Pseudonocardia sp. Ae356_Ps1]
MRRPFILMYHSVGRIGDDPHRLTVTPERLDAQLAALRAQGLRGRPIRDLAASGGRAVGLTFDDGYADFLTEAVPALQAHGCTATVFALAGLFGRDNEWDPDGDRRPLLDVAGLRAVEDAGMEVGSHGLRHRHLPLLEPDELADEVRTSRNRLSLVLGRPVDGFAYPYGELGGREVEAVRRAGYRYACAVDPRGSAAAGIHALPRSYAGQRDTGPRLLAKRLRHAGRVAVSS